MFHKERKRLFAPAVLAVLLVCVGQQNSWPKGSSASGGDNSGSGQTLSSSAPKASRTLTIVRLGSDQVSIRAPKGFVDPSIDLPDVRANIERFSPPKMDVIASFIPSAHVLDILAGADRNPDYAIVTTLRSERNKYISPKAFEEAKAEYRASAAQLGDQVRDIVKEMVEKKERPLSDFPELGAELLKAGFVGLGVLDETDRTITTGMLLRTTDQSKQQEVINATVAVQAAVLVKGKVLLMIVVRTYHTAEDVFSTAALTQRWVSSVLSENRGPRSVQSGP